MDTGERTETAGATRRADLLLAGAAAVAAAGWGVVAVTVVGFTLGSDFGLGTQADGRFSGGELARSALWVAVPCALVAWVLGFVSLRSTRGASAGGRVLSMVLWTAASPVICALVFTGWLATGSSDGGGLTAIGLGIGMSAAGVAMWCVTPAPLVVALVVRGSLCRHPVTQEEPGADPSSPQTTGATAGP